MTFRSLAALAAVSILASCGGGGGTAIKRLSGDDLNRIGSDPRVVRARGIVERADSLLIPSVRLHGTVRAQGQSESLSNVVRFNCSGIRCAGSSGGALTITDFVYPGTEVHLAEAAFGGRGGFDTVRATARADLSEALPAGVTVSSFPSATGWGFWGDYGYAEVNLMNGPISVRFHGVHFSGSLRSAFAFSLGETSGTNPGGFGSARWRGIAEAVSVNSYRRHQGTATLAISDLSRPRVDVDVRIGGRSIGSPAWRGMTLRGGSYGAGSVGRDYLRGNLHGPDHSETYGVFDTGAYVGAFGAKRN